MLEPDTQKVKVQIAQHIYSAPCIDGGNMEKAVSTNDTTYSDPCTNGGMYIVDASMSRKLLVGYT